VKTITAESGVQIVSRGQGGIHCVLVCSSLDGDYEVPEVTRTELHTLREILKSTLEEL